jgi:YD repeat-containing protein
VYVFGWLLACAALVDPPVSCHVAEDTPGDPVYLDCLIHRQLGSTSDDVQTDALGRAVSETRGAGPSTEAWTWEWEGSCVVRETYTDRGADGTVQEAWDATRTCDEDGNETSIASIRTTWNADGVGSTTTDGSTTAYTYDAAGHPLVALTTPSGSDTPTLAWTCTWSAWEGPDACVGDLDMDEPPDQWKTWTYDEDGNSLQYRIWSVNPGLEYRSSRTRDRLGRTATVESYDSVLGSMGSGTFTYEGARLDHVEWTGGTNGAEHYWYFPR